MPETTVDRLTALAACRGLFPNTNPTSEADYDRLQGELFDLEGRLGDWFAEPPPLCRANQRQLENMIEDAEDLRRWLELAGPLQPG